MKIKTKALDFDTVLSVTPKKHIRPKKPNILFRTLLKIVSIPDLLATRFTYKKIGMEKLQKNEPCLYLMNHSSFIDLKIVSHILYPRPFNIVCTSDGFVGKNWLMRNLGCVPTKNLLPIRCWFAIWFTAPKNSVAQFSFTPRQAIPSMAPQHPCPTALPNALKCLAFPLL